MGIRAIDRERTSAKRSLRCGPAWMAAAYTSENSCWTKEPP